MAHDQDNGRADSGFGFHRRRGHGGFAHGDLSPEDLFNMFFHGGGMGGGGPRMFFNRGGGGGFRPHGEQQRQQREEGNRTQGGGSPFQQLFNLLPILLLIIMSLSNMGGSPASPYALHKHDSYTIERKTSHVSGVVPNIPYFVASGFIEKHPLHSKDLYRVEKAVVSSFAEYNAQQCAYETEKKSRSIYYVSTVSYNHHLNVTLYCKNFPE
jgi:DnaJ family protein B protein 12